MYISSCVSFTQAHQARRSRRCPDARCGAEGQEGRGSCHCRRGGPPRPRGGCARSVVCRRWPPCQPAAGGRYVPPRRGWRRAGFPRVTCQPPASVFGPVPSFRPGCPWHGREKESQGRQDEALAACPLLTHAETSPHHRNGDATPPPFPGPRTLPPPPPHSPFRARLSSSHPPPLPTISQLLPPRLAPPTATRCSKPDEPVRPRRQHHHLLPSVACHGVGRGGRGAQRGDAWAPPPAARGGTQPAGARPRAAPTHPSKGRNVVGWRAAKGAALKAPPLFVTVLLPWERL